MKPSTLTLSTLAPNPGSRQKRKRVGRGEGSGLGKTSTKGGKGQTARSGGRIGAGFEGGQMPLYRRLGKLGFRSRGISSGLNRYHVINVSDLERFDNGAEITLAAVTERGLARHGKPKAGLKVLGDGALTKKITVRAAAVSASARSKIEAAGGTVIIEASAAKGEKAAGAALKA